MAGEDGTTGEEQPKASLVTSLIVPLVAATVVAAGAGMVFGMQIADLVAPKPEAEAAAGHGKSDGHGKAADAHGKSDGHGKADAHGKEAAPAKPAKPLEMTVVPINQILTSMPGPRSVWVRVEASVVFDGPTNPEFNVLAQKIGEDIVAYLKVTNVDQIEGASGFQYLREDINERARIRGQGKVREVVVQSLLIE